MTKPSTPPSSSLVAAFSLVAVLSLAGAGRVCGKELQPKPADPHLAKYEGLKAPEGQAAVLKKGDKLAICGDSITEQKMYSRIMETYLTACVPELAITCRQYGWSGEQAGGFLNRLDQDVLRFKPNAATTCYGMNDHRYVPYTEEIGGTYRKLQTQIVQKMKAAGVKVVLGSPGTIGTMPFWVKSATGTQQDLNLSLLKLRDMDIEIAEQEKVNFADVYWPMLLANEDAQRHYGADFVLYGKDGVHPGWAGQAVMAHAFLLGLGLDGDLGGISLDLATGKAEGRAGHEVLSAANGEVKVRSSRYPFCPGPGDIGKDDNLRAGFALVPFMEKLNRFTLMVKNAPQKGCKVTWGTETKTFHKEELEEGVNLAAWVDHPLCAAFNKVSEAVLAKQSYETKQIKQIFHGEEGKKDIEAAVTRTEAERKPLVEALAASLVPVEHVLKVEGVK